MAEGRDRWEAPDPADVRRGYVSGLTFQDREVEYVAVDGLAICESCIILGTIDEMERRVEEVEGARARGLRPKAIVIDRAQLRWPGGVIPFSVHQFPEPERVAAAIRHWTDRTVIRFVEVTPANIGQFRDFVHFVPVERGCNSPIGRRGGRQEIRLSPRCALRQVIHEIGHTVGMYHEQSREDRDAHVTIHFENMDTAHRMQFTQQLNEATDLGPYDHASIMHYDALAFSTNGQPTISSKPPGIRVGQATDLSAGDVDAVRRLYATA